MREDGIRLAWEAAGAVDGGGGVVAGGGREMEREETKEEGRQDCFEERERER